MCSKLTILKNTKYLKKVKTKIVNEVNTIYEMKLAITNSLHDFEKSKEIKGWVKYSDNVITTQLELLPKYRKEELRKKLSHSIIGMNTYSIDFCNSVDNRIFDLVCNSPYIDKFKRIIEIQICDDNESAVINIESYFSFVNLNGCKNFYRSSPVFPILSEAQSYKHLKFEINNIDCLSKINSSIQISENNNQFKFLVKNIYPINEVEIFDECTIFHKTQCKVHLQNFYQYHALIFPCRDYTLEIVLKKHNNKYYLALAKNEFFNVNNYVERTQYRDKHICNINYIDWLLPGSGYSFTIQKIDEEDQNKNIEDEEFYESIFDNHKSDEYRLSYSSDPSVAILTTEEAYVKLSRRNGNVTDYDAKLAMCVLDRLYQLLPKDIDNELLLLRGVWNND